MHFSDTMKPYAGTQSYVFFSDTMKPYAGTQSYVFFSDTMKPYAGTQSYVFFSDTMKPYAGTQSYVFFSDTMKPYAVTDFHDTVFFSDILSERKIIPLHAEGLLLCKFHLVSLKQLTRWVCHGLSQSVVLTSFCLSGITSK